MSSCRNALDCSTTSCAGWISNAEARHRVARSSSRVDWQALKMFIANVTRPDCTKCDCHRSRTASVAWSSRIHETTPSSRMQDLICIGNSSKTLVGMAVPVACAAASKLLKITGICDSPETQMMMSLAKPWSSVYRPRMLPTSRIVAMVSIERRYSASVTGACIVDTRMSSHPNSSTLYSTDSLLNGGTGRGMCSSADISRASAVMKLSTCFSGSPDSSAASPALYLSSISSRAIADCDRMASSIARCWRMRSSRSVRPTWSGSASTPTTAAPPTDASAAVA
mmetsp:Transcript_8008/g.23610  ORF Transcript_8008/g.23610 Transcript_8008/m.23610 type:complete len:282 (-) Transcript_8008:72-917(-)